MYELLEKGDTLHPGGQDTSSRNRDRATSLSGSPRPAGIQTAIPRPCRPTATWTCCIPAPARITRTRCFFMKSSTTPGLPSCPSGILRSNLEAKPAYKTYKDYIAGLLPDPGDPDEGKTNKKCYAEQTAGNGAPLEQNAALQAMYRARDFLRGYSASRQLQRGHLLPVERGIPENRPGRFPHLQTGAGDHWSRRRRCWITAAGAPWTSPCPGTCSATPGPWSESSEDEYRIRRSPPWPRWWKRTWP